jgi:putative ABC transport system permease protein
MEYPGNCISACINQTMIGNYLKIAWRNILRSKLYAAFNILGLSLGLCCCIVIFQVVSYEFSFDRFHPGVKNIYRVGADITDVTGDKLKFIRLSAGFSAVARNSITGIESIAAVIPYNADITILPGNHFKSRDGASPFITTVIVEPDYFDIFKYNWIAGDVTALSEPSRVVLTEARAKEYFGNVTAENIIGKQVVYQDSLVVTVAGVIKQWDKPTDLGYTDFISFATIHQSFLRNTIKFDSVSNWLGSPVIMQIPKLK